MYLQQGHYKTQQFKDLEEKGDFVATVDAINVPIYMPMCSLIDTGSPLRVVFTKLYEPYYICIEAIEY